MSLAGLDTPAVVEAHQASITDPTGWFLLKYQEGSRDTIEVFKKGSGGVPEARNAVESYQEKSPLYGLVQHRRRKVILKYVPEGTSRILQVRLTVQFQSVLDALTPHDTVFSFTTASELSEPAIGVHTMLAPSGAGSITSSTSSLRRRRLKEISEDAEELASAPLQRTEEHPLAQEEEPESTPLDEKRHEDLDELPASALRAKALLAMRNSPEIDVTDHDDPTPRPRSATPLKNQTFEDNTAAPATQYDSAPVLPPIAISPSLDKELPSPPEEQDREIVHAAQEQLGIREGSADNATNPSPEQFIKHSPHLSQAENTSISQWTSEVSAYAVKPKKKKLGPRPHIDPPGRPRTSGLSDTGVRTRPPVANLPTTVKISTDRARMPPTFRPSSQQSSKSMPGRFHSSQQVTTMPPLPSPTNVPNFYRPESRSVIHKTPSLSSETTTGATPEKLRLMKALQMRKRNMLANQRASQAYNAGSEAQKGQPTEPKTNSSSTTPTTATISEAQSRAEDSSFTSRDEPHTRRASLSSDTSSSVTPKAAGSSDKKSAKAEVQRVPVKLSIPSAPQAHQNSTASTPDEGGEESDKAKAEAGSPVEAYKRLTGQIDNPPNFGDSTPEQKQAIEGAAISRTRKGPVPQPLQVPATNPDLSEQSDGESFMDELANATVQEAKPVMVARTPVTPVMSAPTLRDYKDPMRNGEPGIQPRSSSYGALEKPKSSGGRSASALPHWPPQSTDAIPPPLTKKSTLGSGISKRIKALEVLSTRDSTSPPRQPVREIPSKRSAFDTFMKRSSFLKQAPNASTDKSPPKKLAEASSTFAPPPPPKAARPSQNDDQAPAGLFAPAPKGEAVSVTARIIRDHDQVPPSTAPGDLNLHRSPLIVEHERVDDGRQSMSRDGRSQEPPRSPQKGGRFSFSSYRSRTEPRLNTADSSSKLSFSSKAKIPRSVSDNSSLSEKGTTRAQRMFKRVTNLAGRRGGKNLSSSSSMIDFHPQEQPDTIQEEHVRRNGSIAESLLHVVDIGDVNVQFPDTLLWKRRFMRIDDQGYLIFSPPANDANSRNVSRKFHLADFREPTLPDLEREQMAWSVILDLKDGSSIQCACENRGAQQQVLQMLVDAHSAYHQLYGN